MQIGDSVLYYDAEGKEFPVTIQALEDGSAFVTVLFKDGNALTGVPKITAKNVKEKDIIIGPCYDPRPRPNLSPNPNNS